MKKSLVIGLGFLTSIFAIVFISLHFFFKPIATALLHRAGFDDATIGTAQFTLSGTTLTNVALDQYGTVIDRVELYATGADMRAGRIGKAVVSGVHLHWPMTLPRAFKNLQKDGAQKNTSAPLNLHVRDVQFDGVEAQVAIADGVVPVKASGSLIDKGSSYKLSADIAAESSAFVTAQGRLTLEAVKATHALKAHYEIAKANLTLPALRLKRVTGWVNADMSPTALLPVVNAQISIGSALAYGVPLQGGTVTASSAKGLSEFIVNAQVQNNSGDVMIDVKADQTGAQADKVKVSAEAKLKNLDAFNIPDLNGQGSVVLSLAGTRKKSPDVLDMSAWQTLGGNAGITLENLSLPGLVTGAQALATLKLSFNPATHKISAQAVDGPVSFKGTVRKLDPRPLYLNLPLGATPPSVTWDTQKNALTTDIANASFAGANFIAKDISAHVTAWMNGNTVYEGKAKIGQLIHNVRIPYFIPVAVSVEMAPLSRQQDMTGFAGTVRDPAGIIDAKIAGTYNSAVNTGEIVFNMPPKTLQPNVLSLANLFPYSQAFFDNGFGTVGLAADVSFASVDGTFAAQTRGQLFLKDFSCMVAGNTIEGINGVIALDSLSPLTWKAQKISVASINVGLPLTNGVLVTSLDKNSNFTLNSAEWDLAGGHVVSSPFTMSLGDLSTDVTLQARGLDLGQLFKIAPMDGLEATGAVDGTLPLSIRNGSFAIVDGVLQTTAPGTIRYNPKNVPSFLQNSKSQQLIALKVALSAFNYDSLRMTIDGQLDKTQKISLQVKGKNPLFYSGHPVNFNLNVEGPIESILKYSPGSSNIPDGIRKQLEAYEAHNDGK